MVSDTNEDRDYVTPVKIAAVVVTYNRKELLSQCLDGLLRQTRPLDLIIIIDNASTDGTPEFLKNIGGIHPSIVQCIRNTEDLGASAGFHQGMKLAYKEGYDWIWVMDDDAKAESDALEQLLKPQLLQKGDVYALASTVLNPDGSVCITHRRLFDAKHVAEHPIGLEHYKKDYFEIDTASFVGMLISRHAIAELGLPIKDFFMYYDDTEYSLRIRNHGGRIFTVPSSKILHKTSGGEAQHARTRRTPLSWRAFYGRRNMLYTYKKYGKTNAGFYIKLVTSTLKSQVGIILFRQHKLASTKLLWMSIIDGFRGKLGKTIEP